MNLLVVTVVVTLEPSSFTWVVVLDCLAGEVAGLVDFLVPLRDCISNKLEQVKCYFGLVYFYFN